MAGLASAGEVWCPADEPKLTPTGLIDRVGRVVYRGQIDGGAVYGTDHYIARDPGGELWSTLESKGGAGVDCYRRPVGRNGKPTRNVEDAGTVPVISDLWDKAWRAPRCEVREVRVAGATVLRDCNSAGTVLVLVNGRGDVLGVNRDYLDVLLVAARRLSPVAAPGTRELILSAAVDELGVAQIGRPITVEVRCTSGATYQRAADRPTAPMVERVGIIMPVRIG